MRVKAFPYTTDPEQIPTKKIVDITPEHGSVVAVRYACPDACWREHLDAWSRAYRNGDKGVPQPEPYGHCMFKDPVSYGCVPYGCTDPAIHRQAHERHVRAQLDGWDRDMDKERLDQIVKAAVDQRMAGEEVGVWPYLACVATHASA